MPDKWKRNTMMFSATFPKEIQLLAANFMRTDYIWISVGRVGAAAESVEQRFVPIYHRHGKTDALYAELDQMHLDGRADKKKDKVLILTFKVFFNCPH